MKRFLVTPRARQDLDDITTYLLKHTNGDRARRVVRDLHSAMAKVAELPDIGHQRDDLADDTLRVYVVYSYLIIYRPETRPLEVIRVVHVARDIGAMFKRPE